MLDKEAKAHIRADRRLQVDRSGGQEIRLTGRNARQMVAVLARSPGMRCKRVTLRKMIREAADDRILANRLRQLKNDLRKALGDAVHHLGGDNSTLWLKQVREVSDMNLPIFDIDGGTVAFEDWRAETVNTCLHLIAPSESVTPAATIPAVCLHFPAPEGPDAAEQAEAAAVAFRDAFAGSDFIALMEADDNSAELSVSFSREGENWRVSLSLRDRLRVLWSQSTTISAAMRRVERFNALLEIAFLSLATVERKLGEGQRSNTGMLLYPSVAQLFSFTRSKVDLAAHSLGDLEGHIDTGTMPACRALARMLQAGARLVGRRAVAEQEAEVFFSEALSHGPGNQGLC